MTKSTFFISLFAHIVFFFFTFFALAMGDISNGSRPIPFVSTILFIIPISTLAMIIEFCTKKRQNVLSVSSTIPVFAFLVSILMLFGA